MSFHYFVDMTMQGNTIDAKSADFFVTNLHIVVMVA